MFVGPAEEVWDELVLEFTTIKHVIEMKNNSEFGIRDTTIIFIYIFI